MVLLFGSHDSSFLQSNRYYHHKTTKMSVFAPKKKIQLVKAGFALFTALETGFLLVGK